jgi:pimeloyl-ACP methyl ester carboxylesterase
MGGFIVQKYLESTNAQLAILMASAPPAGPRGMVRRMATRRPVTFVKTMMTGNATDSPERTRDYLFSPGTPADVVNDCHRRLQPESLRALKDMMRPVRPERVTTPVAVLGAENDWLVAPPKDLTATARAYHTTAQTLPGGHDMMLDTAWEQAAVAIQTAIARQLAPR